jgi:S-adenosylmethionine hydrolase
MAIITLTTDYGLKDHFVGVLKGKIISNFLEAIIIDITHTIDPFNIFQSSYIIGAAYKNFPKGTVHLIGVDVESNKENKQVAMLWNDHNFVGADNGILSLLISDSSPLKLVTIDPEIAIFKDKNDIDILTITSCYLAQGGSINALGSDIEKLKEIKKLEPIYDGKNTLKGHVIYTDNFGNIVTNISKKMFINYAQDRNFEIIFNERSKKKNNLKKIHEKYSAIAEESEYSLKNFEGQILAIFNDADFLEIAIFRSNPSTVGSAKSLLGLHFWDVITIEFKDKNNFI